MESDRMQIKVIENSKYCAWCGTFGEVQEVTTHIKEIKPIIILIIVNLVKTFEYSIVVPICHDCKDRHRKRRAYMFGISSLLAVISTIIGGIFLLRIKTDFVICGMAAFLLGIVGAIIGAVLSHILIHIPEWGTIRKGKIILNNDTFREYVSTVNPEFMERELSQYADRVYTTIIGHIVI